MTNNKYTLMLSLPKYGLKHGFPYISRKYIITILQGISMLFLMVASYGGNKGGG